MRGFFANVFGGRSPADDLIKWLADKSLDDRRIVAGFLYGGAESDRVYAWVASQGDCDRGTASMIFWNMLVPRRFAQAQAEGRDPGRLWGFSTMTAIVARWERDDFRPAVFEWDTREDLRVYRRLLKKHFNGRDPLQLPESLMVAVRGRRPVGSPAVALGDDTRLDRLLQALRSTHQGA